MTEYKPFTAEELALHRESVRNGKASAETVRRLLATVDELRTRAEQAEIKAKDLEAHADYLGSEIDRLNVQINTLKSDGEIASALAVQVDQATNELIAAVRAERDEAVAQATLLKRALEFATTARVES